MENYIVVTSHARTHRYSQDHRWSVLNSILLWLLPKYVFFRPILCYLCCGENILYYFTRFVLYWFMFFHFSPGIFQPHIQYLMCLATPVDIILLGVSFYKDGEFRVLKSSKTFYHLSFFPGSININNRFNYISSCVNNAKKYVKSDIQVLEYSAD